MKKASCSIAMMLLLAVVVFVGAGCTEPVPGGYIGQVRTPKGWSKEILPPGNHACNGRDQMYLLQTTNEAYSEHLDILVGGKVNLKFDFTVRVRPKLNDTELMLQSFDAVTADDKYRITVKQMYDTFLKMKAMAVPRRIYEAEPDIQTAVSNSGKLAAEMRKELIEAAASTPLDVIDSEVTNYDWPPELTAAQNKLAESELLEAAAENRVRAELKESEGRVKVEKANALVEKEKSEGVAGGIRIVKEELKDSPEYLVWWQIRAMSAAAQGPNNCFVFAPYATSSAEMKAMMGNAQLVQMLHPDGLRKDAKADARSHPKEVIDLEKFDPETLSPKPDAPAPPATTPPPTPTPAAK